MVSWSGGHKQAKVYFFREEGELSGPAVNVFVDGNYLASVLDGGYRAAIVCSTGDQVLPSFTRNTSFADRDTGVDYNFAAGETAYVKITAGNQGEPIFQRVDVAEGQRAIGRLRRQTQTLPRVRDVRTCEKAVLEKITLEAHSLFKFDKWDYKNMLPEGKEEIANVGEKIRSNQVKISDIKVVGYTDPRGSNAYNVGLSQRRAMTVKKALQSAGVNVPITTEGLGERNLVVRGCLKKHRSNRKARMSCDQPNRRVEIIIYGTRSRSK
ncbi:MAG: cell envelope biogenesis protein OmpA [Gammaproteobacteria bacterium]|nr:MAG: cell envelope biogenesis protein OmpA [Gammaproteobacteria bacterium]